MQEEATFRLVFFLGAFMVCAGIEWLRPKRAWRESRLTRWRINLAIILMNNLANLYETMGLYDQAEPLMKSALSLVEEVRGANDHETARQSNNLALLFESQGSFREAEPLYKKAIAVLEGLLGEDHIDTVALKNNLAFLYFMMNQYELAAPAFTDVLSRWTRTLGEDHPNRLKALNIS